MISEQDIRHCRNAITVSNRSAVQLYGRLMNGEQPESDMSEILRHVDRLKSDLEPVLTFAMLITRDCRSACVVGALRKSPLAEIGKGPVAPGLPLLIQSLV